MIKNKKGFTLSEVLICIMIIGIIMALSVNSIKIVKESYTSLTYFAFKNLEAMITVLSAGAAPVGTEAALEDADGTKLPAMTRQCISSNGTIIQVLKADGEYNTYNTPYCAEREKYFDSENSNLFCRSLASIANTAGSINCTDLASSDFKANENGYTEPYLSDFNYDSPNFITSNGQRFYISEWTINAKVSSKYGYRLVGIDINGTSKPNIITVNSYLLPDIITFLILDNGEIFPLGVAADNYTKNGRIYQYLNTKVKGYYFYDPDSDPTSSYSSSQRSSSNIPSECTVKNVQTCNYSVVPITNSQGKSFFSYREAYCNAIDSSQLEYDEYCDSISKYDLCPISQNSQAFDLCKAETVKPMFRFNF